MQKPVDDDQSQFTVGQGDKNIPKKTGSAMSVDAGTYLFYAPELFSRDLNGHKMFGEASDIWAMGLTFFYILTGH